MRQLLTNGILQGRREPLGSRFRWVLELESVDAYLSAHGKFPGGRSGPRGKPSIELQLEDLSAQIKELRDSDSGSTRSIHALAVERDDLRATLVSMGESLARVQAAMDLQARADVERGKVVEHLTAAVLAAERADEHRRGAITELQEALADARRAGHAGALRA